MCIRDSHQVDTEAVLQLGVLIKKVQNDIGIGAALQFDHAAHTVLIGLVANEGHAVNLDVYKRQW